MLPVISLELDHGYLTVPQKSLGGRRLPYLRGKGLGGSTLTNFMIYLSGARDDYDHWAELVVDDAWKWENIHRRLKEVSWYTRWGMRIFNENSWKISTMK
jgi:choline dehydrogenase-like flavoprotein